jgi:oxygen-independent coproporphyrinogen-3 oxidase
MALICQFKLNFQDIEQAFELDFKVYFAQELAVIKKLAQDGLLTLSDTQIQVQPIGRLLIRNICMVFDAYLGSITTNNYSAAI